MATLETTFIGNATAFANSLDNLQFFGSNSPKTKGKSKRNDHYSNCNTIGIRFKLAKLSTNIFIGCDFISRINTS
jgi:hypothetical protein